MGVDGLGKLAILTTAVKLFTDSLRIVGDREAEFNTLQNNLNGLVDNTENAANALLKADRLGDLTLFSQSDFMKTSP